MNVVIERQDLPVEGNLVTKFCCHRTLVNRIAPINVCSLGYRLTFERSKSKSLHDVSVTRIGDSFPTVFRRLFN